MMVTWTILTNVLVIAHYQNQDRMILRNVETALLIMILILMPLRTVTMVISNQEMVVIMFAQLNQAGRVRKVIKGFQFVQNFVEMV